MTYRAAVTLGYEVADLQAHVAVEQLERGAGRPKAARHSPE
jgi:hypothetical protein